MESLGDYGEWVARWVRWKRRYGGDGWDCDWWGRLVHMSGGHRLWSWWNGSFCSAMTRAATRGLVGIGG